MYALIKLLSLFKKILKIQEFFGYYYYYYYLF